MQNIGIGPPYIPAYLLHIYFSLRIYLYAGSIYFDLLEYHYSDRFQPYQKIKVSITRNKTLDFVHYWIFPPYTFYTFSYNYPKRYKAQLLLIIHSLIRSLWKYDFHNYLYAQMRSSNCSFFSWTPTPPPYHLFLHTCEAMCAMDNRIVATHTQCTKIEPSTPFNLLTDFNRRAEKKTITSRWL